MALLIRFSLPIPVHWVNKRMKTFILLSALYDKPRKRKLSKRTTPLSHSLLPFRVRQTDKASEFGSEILKKLDNVSTLTDLQPLEVKGNFPYKVKGPSTPQAPVTDEDLCTQCEYCIDVCPVAAISIVDDRMFSDPSLCIKCCACVKECPEGARTFDTPYTAMLHKNFSARREPELFI